MRAYELVVPIGMCVWACSLRSLEPLLCPPEQPDCERSDSASDGGPVEGDAGNPQPFDGGAADATVPDAAGDGGDDACPAPCSPAVELLYAPSSADERIRFSFALRNVSRDAIALAELTVRYYFTTETGGEQVYECSSVIEGDFACEDVRWSNAQADGVGANRYVELGFAEAAGSLAGDGMRTGIVKGLIRNADFSDFDQSNDYSYAELSELSLHERMTVYRNGKLLWGIEPE